MELPHAVPRTRVVIKLQEVHMFYRSLIALLLVSSGCTDSAQNRAPDVPYVPTSPEVVDKMLEMAQVGPRDVVYDLGSGDGRIVITAAKKYGAKGIGVDIDPQRVREAKANAMAAGVTDKVTIKQGDLFNLDISQATVVTLYLLPNVNIKLRPKLWDELKPGTRVVSHNYHMGDWKPDQVAEVGDHAVYLWTIREEDKQAAR
jgi:precorrin-6B methylase 2